MDQMPESTPVFDALDASPALQIDGADVNIAELPQDVDALKSIIARLISKASQLERVIAEQLIEKDQIAVIHSIEQQRMYAIHKPHAIQGLGLMAKSLGWIFQGSNRS
jgi:hypothetical protein